MDYETTKKAEMNKINEPLNREKSKLATLSNVPSKKKKTKIEKNIKMLEKEKKILLNKQSYNFEIELDGMELDCVVQHGKITKLLILAALIPSSTTEVERLFSLKRKSGLKIIFLKLVYFHLSSPIKHFCENSLLF